LTPHGRQRHVIVELGELASELRVHELNYFFPPLLIHTLCPSLPNIFPEIIIQNIIDYDQQAPRNITEAVASEDVFPICRLFLWKL
jgi:hypothetical protein